jgi:alkylation response protein AidB-like acyl-CoA dehydrogenase
MYRLSNEQQSIVDKAAAIATGVLATHAREVDEVGRFPQEGVQALASEGLLGLTVPKEFGGLGEGPRTAVAVLDALAREDASTAMIYLMHLCGIACYASRPDVAEEQLRAAAAGRHLSTLAWSEKGSRSHFWAPVSQAQNHDGLVELNAEKSWVTSAAEADGYVVSSRTPEATEPTDTMLYLVLKGDPGVEVSGPWNAMGMRGNGSAPMRLQNCRIPADRALTEPHQGFSAMLGVVLPLFSVGNAAISIGICEAAVKATTEHLTGTGFQHLASPLAELPNLRARLAKMRIETDKARAHLAAVVDSLENPNEGTTLLVLEAKVQAAETALDVTDIGMRACGGAAFSKHLSLDRQFRDARAASVMAPTSDVLMEFIGRALCGMELF